MPFTNYIGSSAITQPGVVDNAAQRPATPYEGQVIYEKDTNRVLVWDNSAWVMVADTDAPPGMQLIRSQTVGTAVPDTTVSDVFSAEFDNYLITWNGGTMSNQTALRCRLNNITSTNYYGSLIYNAVNNTTPLGAVDNATPNWNYAGGGNPDQAGCHFELHNPFVSRFKFIRNSSVQYGITIDGAMGVYQGFTNVTTSCTGFRLQPFVGTMTGGTIRVYGYRN